MTPVAGKTVVHVSPNIAMLIVHRRAVVRVAIQTTKNRIVRCIRVAFVARAPSPCMSARVDRETMGDRRTDPCDRRMARFAGLRESGGNMVGTGDRCKFPAVTGVTAHGRAGIPPANVAARALGRRVGASQQKTGPAVIEGSSIPLRRGVTHLAVLRKTGGHVVRIRCGGVSGQVARNTCGAHSRVLTRRVTGCAG